MAVGGNGATCNPHESGWGSCPILRPVWDDEVVNIENVAGGHYTSPVFLSNEYTEYILQGDVTADSTGFIVDAVRVIINLNGFTLTYNEVDPGEGVTNSTYHIHNIAVINGSIIQGAAQSEGDVYGGFCNPIGTCNSLNGNCRESFRAHFSNLYLRYGGRDVGGIKWSGKDMVVKQCTLEDTYEFGTLKNRHQGVDAIDCGGAAHIESNTIINARHRGISTMHDADVFDNVIGIRSMCTNSFGISGYKKKRCRVHHNTIVGRGEHPLGIGYVSEGTEDIEVYNNDIDCEVTRIGTEYGDIPDDPNTIYPGMFATGFRSTWGGDQIDFHNNKIRVRAHVDYDGHYSPDGTPCRIETGCKGLFISCYPDEISAYHHNDIEAMADGESTRAYGVTITPNKDVGLTVHDNVIKSNVYPMVLVDQYGNCHGYPLITHNELVKVGNLSTFATYAMTFKYQLTGQVRIVSDTYSDGAARDDISFKWGGGDGVDVWFGHDASPEPLYEYRWHDNEGADDFGTKEIFDPPIPFPYPTPPQPEEPDVCPIGGNSSFANIGDGNSSIVLR